jgi:hypothetical protein
MASTARRSWFGGEEAYARQIRGIAVLADGRIALAAGNAILVRALP